MCIFRNNNLEYFNNTEHNLTVNYDGWYNICWFLYKNLIHIYMKYPDFNSCQNYLQFDTYQIWSFLLHHTEELAIIAVLMCSKYCYRGVYKGRYNIGYHMKILNMFYFL